MTDLIPAKSRPTFTLILRAERGVDAIRALRALLKVTLRRYGLKCLSAVQNKDADDDR